MANSYDVAGNVVTNAAAEMGLIAFSAKAQDPFASSDPNLGQLCQLLTSVGRNLRREAQWNKLRQTWVFQTVANTGLYALPTDFDRVIDQTAWNRSNRLPLGGPVSPQTFEFMKARLVGISWNVLWDVLQGQFQAYPDDTTPGGYTIAYQYMSSFWVVPTGVPSYVLWVPGVTYTAGTVALSGGNLYTCATGGKSGTTASLAGTGSGITDGTCVWNWNQQLGRDQVLTSADLLLFDPQLLNAALKLAFKLEKGFDATAAQAQYEDELTKALNADTVAPVLNFNRPVYSEPLLGPWNLPTNGTAGQ